MNLITELYPYFKKLDEILDTDKILDMSFETAVEAIIIPENILCDRRLNILFQCSGILSKEAGIRVFTEMYYLYQKGCFRDSAKTSSHLSF